jgi:hypothetical protein
MSSISPSRISHRSSKSGLRDGGPCAVAHLRQGVQAHDAACWSDRRGGEHRVDPSAAPDVEGDLTRAQRRMADGVADAEGPSDGSFRDDGQLVV